MLLLKNCLTLYSLKETDRHMLPKTIMVRQCPKLPRKTNPNVSQPFVFFVRYVKSEKMKKTKD